MIGSDNEKRKKKNDRRWLRWAIRIAGVLAVVVMIAMIMQPQPVPVDLAVLETGELQVSLDEEGETRVRDRYVVSAPFAGRVLRIELEPGDEVTARETVLATFEPADPTLLDARSEAQARARVRAAEASLGRAKAERERAEAEQGFARTDLQRVERLREEQVVPEERLEQARLEARRAEETVEASTFAVEAANHELEMAKAGLLQATGRGDAEPLALTAPVDGVVLRRLRESESVVPAGEALLEVADPERLEIVSDYLSKDAVRIEEGSRVSIEQWGGEVPLHGTVRRVEPSGFTKVSALGVEEQRVNVIVDFEDSRAAWEALGDGYRVEVRVITYEAEDILKVPTSALFRQGEGWAVFRVEAQHATVAPVELGQRNGLEAEVLSGLEAGQTVIVHPSDAVAEGVLVGERGS